MPRVWTRESGLSYHLPGLEEVVGNGEETSGKMSEKFFMALLVFVIIVLCIGYIAQSNKIKDLQWQSEVIKKNYNDLVDKYRITIQAKEAQ